MSGWGEGSRFLNNSTIISDFNFDKNDQVHRILGMYNYRTFPNKGAWTSPHILWQRVGLGIFEFKLIKTTIPQKGDIVVLTKTVNRRRMELKCKVVQAHLRSRNEVGTVSISGIPSYSKSCGKCVLDLLSIKF